MKLLFVAETSSIHSARWVNQFTSCDGEIHVAQGAYPFTSVNPEYRAGIFHVPGMIERSAEDSGGFAQKVNRAAGLVISRIPYCKTVIPGKIHARLIRKLKPDIIHTLGLNINWKNNCLATLRAKKELGMKFPAPWVYSTWGSDLDFYARQSEKNAQRVTEVLSSVDYLITECARDERLAYSFGFSGTCLGHLPAYGGVPIAEYARLKAPGPGSSKKIIFLKGRDHHDGDPVGRAMVAMEAFALCTKELRDYTIVISQAGPAIVNRARLLVRQTGLDIRILPFLPENELLKTLGSSRVFISLTVNDGLPGTLVEAMALGAFPLHSDLEPIREWITSGKNGMLVPPEDPAACAEALQRALGDDTLIDAAGAENRSIVKEKLDRDVIRDRATALYQKIAQEWHPRS